MTAVRRPGSHSHAARATDLVPEDREREHDRQRSELRPRRDGERQRRRGKQVVPPARVGDRDLEPQDGPEEHRIRDDLGHHEPGEDHPGHEDGQRGDRERPRARDDLPREQVRGDRGARHHERVQHVRGAERLGWREHPKERREQEGIELAVDLDREAVHGRQRRPGVGDRGRELHVQQLVGHHRPIADAPGEADREHRAYSEPEQGEPCADGKARVLLELGACPHGAKLSALTVAHAVRSVGGDADR